MLYTFTARQPSSLSPSVLCRHHCCPVNSYNSMLKGHCNNLCPWIVAGNLVDPPAVKDQIHAYHCHSILSRCELVLTS